jgi:UV excision repair protein RAD23
MNELYCHRPCLIHSLSLKCHLVKQEQQKSELVAESMKLIHSGKVLKDSETIADCRIQPNAFLVVMISKKKKPAAEVPSKDVVDSKPAAAVESSNPEVVPTAATAGTTSATTNTAAPSTPAVVPSSSSSSSSSAAPSIPLAPPRNRTAPSSPQQQQQQQQQGDDNEEDHNVSFAASEQQDGTGTGTDNDLSPEAISNLMAMGFPEAEVRACLGAAGGNPNLAVEFLMNGIPEQPVRMGGNSAAAAAAPASFGREAQGQEPLGQLRNHPQIDQLRQLVQSNPAMLQAVLTQIGQQQPELLQEITRHQELFLQIMNEPVGTTSSSGSNGVRSGGVAAATAAAASSGGSMMEAPMGPGGLTADMMQGLGNPAQLAQMIDSMTPEQLQSMSAMMGLTPEQLRMTAQAISRMPPEELQNYMNMAMEAGMGDEEGMLGDITGQGRGGGGDGSQYVTLTEEELAAVERLTAMGFDRMEVIQAYLACDKNEEVAANLLMDGGFGFGGFGDDDGMGGGHDDDDDDGDDMYD